MNNLWVSNWEDIKQRYIKWWNHEGMILRIEGLKAKVPHDIGVQDPGIPLNSYDRHTNALWRAKANRHWMANMTLLADTLPIAMPDWGTVSLCTYLGSEPEFEDDTVWYKPCLDEENIDKPILFDATSKWWKIQEAMVKETSKSSNGNYLIGCPALTPGLDCLGALRGTQDLMMDMLESPDWVKEKLNQINKAYFQAAEALYQMISMEDGSSSFGYFWIWGPGKTAQVQCDLSAMISPDMFKEFVVPNLTEQCKWLDNALYHLDGTQCLCHLEHILDIKEIKAIQWTPQAGIEQAGNPRWYDLYKRILKAGKSVQVLGVNYTEIEPLLKEVGANGMFISTYMEDEEKAKKLVENVYGG